MVRIFHLMLVLLYIYIDSTNIPPIIIINRIYEHQNLVAVACFLPGWAKDLSAPMYNTEAFLTSCANEKYYPSKSSYLTAALL
jgi:hypothetical protein